ncbi:hypothetical protein NDU88_009567, partial [Pleurodeles waltl]
LISSAERQIECWRLDNTKKQLHVTEEHLASSLRFVFRKGGGGWRLHLETGRTTECTSH